MTKTFSKDSDQFKMFREFWELYQRYYEPEKDQQYWDALTADFMTFTDRHKSQFATDLSVAFLNDLDRRWKEKNGKKQ